MSAPSLTTPMPITASFLRKRMPRTPAAVRPMKRTSSSEKRIDWPCTVARTMSFFPSVSITHCSSSPLCSLTAMSPPFRRVSNSLCRVFFTTPCRVAMKRYRSSRNLRIARTALTTSPDSIWIKLITAVPRAWRLASGTSCTRSR